MNGWEVLIFGFPYYNFLNKNMSTKNKTKLKGGEFLLKESLSNEIFTPEEGLLIIFPSYLEHRVLPQEDLPPRYSIAFNIIPKGEFGPFTGKMFL